MDESWATAVFASLFIGTIARLASANPTTLANDRWSVAIEPSTLAITSSAGEVSAGNAMRVVADLKQTSTGITWRWTEAKIDVAVAFDGPRLHVTFHADAAGELTWPILPANASRRGFIVPVFEGLYVGSDDTTLGAFLSRDPLSAVGDLSMPFWGVDLGDRTLTYALDDPFHTDLAFTRPDGTLAASATHAFDSLDQQKIYGLTIALGDTGPATPAIVYRQLLIERGQFVSLKQKIERTPDVARLLGAAHIYLWGPGTLAREDAFDFRAFAKAFVAAPVGKQLLATFDASTKALVRSMPDAPFVSRYKQGVFIDAINTALPACRL